MRPRNRLVRVIFTAVHRLSSADLRRLRLSVFAHGQPRSAVRPADLRRGRARLSAVVLTSILAMCGGSVVGCGSGAKHTANKEAESTATALEGGEEAREEQAAKRRAARLKKLEAAEEADIKRKLEALRQAQARAEAEASAAESQKSSGAGKGSQRSTSKPKRSTSRPKKTTKRSRSSGESPAEKAAREQFAKEEAQEEAAFKKREREEAAGG